MTKIAILGDTHFGVRSDNKIFLDYQSEFYNKVFWPEIDRRKIQVVIQVGDLVDRRKNINYITLADGLQANLLNPLLERGIDFYGIPGNHDMPLKTSMKYNSFATLFGVVGTKPKQFNWFDQPTEVKIYGKKFLFVPWICEENSEQIFAAIAKSKASTMIGHLELVGFEMHRGYTMTHGMDASLFSKFQQVITGHYHSHSIKDNIVYTGVPYQLTWSDHGDPKGFFIMDCDTGDLEFVENTITLFDKVFYNDKRADFRKWATGDFSQYKNKFVKVIVETKSSQKMFNKVISFIEAAGAYNVQVVEQATFKPEVALEIDSESHDLFPLIKQRVEATDYQTFSKFDLITHVKDLYDRATEVYMA